TPAAISCAGLRHAAHDSGQMLHRESVIHVMTTTPAAVAMAADHGPVLLLMNPRRTSPRMPPPRRPPILALNSMVVVAPLAVIARPNPIPASPHNNVAM